MRPVARFALIVVIALAVGAGSWLVSQRLRHDRRRASIIAWLNRTNPTPRPQTPAAPAKTNAAVESPDGFFIGKGTDRVYFKYGTTNPMLRSLLESVMDGSTDPGAKGREVFLKLCAACHQPDGAGKDGVAPPLAGSEWALGPGGGRMVRMVLNGLKGPIRVQGREWNLAMPAWRDSLSDEQIALVLTYVRTQLPGNQAGAIKQEDVAEARAEPRTTPETAEELLQLPEK